MNMLPVLRIKLPLLILILSIASLKVAVTKVLSVILVLPSGG